MLFQKYFSFSIYFKFYLHNQQKEKENFCKRKLFLRFSVFILVLYFCSIHMFRPKLLKTSFV